MVESELGQLLLGECSQTVETHSDFITAPASAQPIVPSQQWFVLELRVGRQTAGCEERCRDARIVATSA